MNRTIFLGLVKEHKMRGHSTETMAKRRGVSRSTMARRLRGDMGSMTVDDIKFFMREFRLTRERAADIFLPNYTFTETTNDREGELDCSDGCTVKFANGSKLRFEPRT